MEDNFPHAPSGETTKLTPHLNRGIAPQKAQQELQLGMPNHPRKFPGLQERMRNHPGAIPDGPSRIPELQERMPDVPCGLPGIPDRMPDHPWGMPVFPIGIPVLSTGMPDLKGERLFPGEEGLDADLDLDGANEVNDSLLLQYLDL